MGEQLLEARRAADYGVARVAASFASDLAEAREAVRLLSEALEKHIRHHGDPTGGLRDALDAGRQGMARMRAPGSRSNSR
jgi:hypothetical protein